MNMDFFLMGNFDSMTKAMRRQAENLGFHLAQISEKNLSEGTLSQLGMSSIRICGYFYAILANVIKIGNW